MSGTLIRLAENFRRGADLALHLTDLQSEADFEIVGVGRRPPVPSTALLAALAKDVVADVLRWEDHILEVIYGVDPSAGPDQPPRPGFDPALTSLAAREAAKAAELCAAGLAVKASRVKWLRQRYEAQGPLGLVNKRKHLKTLSMEGRCDPRIADALRAAIAETVPQSTRTISWHLTRAVQILEDAYGAAAPPMPALATQYRLFKRVKERHTLGSATTRRSIAARPVGPFGKLQVDAPGEVVQIDSTPLDVLVQLPHGVIGKVELVGMIDVATRTVLAAVLAPTAKSVDASTLLARCLVPEPMRPGWVDALRMAHSVLPYRRLMSVDERLEHAAARPVIMPYTVVYDHGGPFISKNFRASCRYLGIHPQPAHLGSGHEKGNIERFFGTVATGFAQFVSGYTGRNPDRRGYRVEKQPLWTLPELQAFLDEWILAKYQNQPHEGLRDPGDPARKLSPNEKYAAMVEYDGYLPVALGEQDYIELLPHDWRRIQPGGVRFHNRHYDCLGEALNPLRGQDSRIAERNNKWEIHFDPYDVSCIWVRNHHEVGTGPGGWIRLVWRHLKQSPIPFGELAWSHVEAEMPVGTSEQQLAESVQALLRRAGAGPEPTDGRLSSRDKTVAARTAATAGPRAGIGPPQPDAEPDDDLDLLQNQTPEPEPEGQPGPGDTTPLRIFDPHEAAACRW
jgi:transposase InsO family protein